MILTFVLVTTNARGRRDMATYFAGSMFHSNLVNPPQHYLLSIPGQTLHWCNLHFPHSFTMASDNSANSKPVISYSRNFLHLNCQDVAAAGHDTFDSNYSSRSMDFALCQIFWKIKGVFQDFDEEIWEKLCMKEFSKCQL